jgi:hypothetical protein
VILARTLSRGVLASPEFVFQLWVFTCKGGNTYEMSGQQLAESRRIPG